MKTIMKSFEEKLAEAKAYLGEHYVFHPAQRVKRLRRHHTSPRRGVQHA